MRRNYNILWLDDNFSKHGLANSVNYYEKKVRKHLEDLGYEGNIIEVSNEKEVNNELSKEQKIDLFISDYNIDEDYKGLDFLKDARKKYLQEVILYSNVSEFEIKDYIIKHLQNGSLELNFMSKFIFQSAIEPMVLTNTINDTIDSTLIKWNELNALRGFYLSETSQVHEELKDYFNKLSDYESIKKVLEINKSRAKEKCENLLTKIDEHKIDIYHLDFYDCQLMLCDYYDDFFKLYNEVRNIRNQCAHVTEHIDENNLNYLKLKDGTKIYEKDIIQYRKKLFDFCEKINKKISNEKFISQS